jgi:tRNA modification GTPase
VEFHVHGNPLLVARLLEYLGQIGIRLAQPGEFTKRALLNGKQSLLDVEALKDLMSAATDAQLRQAQARSGGVPAWVAEAKAKIASLAASMEACVDYGEDEGMTFNMRGFRDETKALAAKFHVEQKRSASARWLRDGIKIAIVGRSNAGKSTLFNALANEDRAIVSEIPGTTRDILEARCEWAGLPLLLFDMAGMRQTSDPVEKLGIAKITPVLQKADMILHLVPVTDNCPDPEMMNCLNPYSEKTLTVRNQCDLARAEGLCVSAKSGILAPLEDALKQCFLGELSPDTCLGALATERQRELLADISCQIELLAALPDDVPLELPASLLQGALGLLARLTGEDRACMSLDAMFSEFCLGK